MVLSVSLKKRAGRKINFLPTSSYFSTDFALL